jgi:F-type H+-transporting ATPase subunit a
MELAAGVPTLTELFDFQPFNDNPLGFSWVVLSMTIAFVLALILLSGLLGSPQVVPGKMQLVGETLFGFVRKNIAEEVIGHDGVRYVPYLTTTFLLIFTFNFMEVFPFIAFPPASKIAVPLFFALLAWLVYNVEGIRHHGGKYFTELLFPPGVPKLLYILLTPIEFLSNIVIRPITLTLRLTFNMLAGHLILTLITVLAAATWAASPKALALPFVIAIGVVLTAFEIFVGFLQAFIFTTLTALYIGGAVHPAH